MSTEFFYYPFETNWYSEERWRNELARSPRGVSAALQGYRRVLTDDAIFAQSWMHHSLATDYRFVGNRWRVLETGFVLNCLRQLRDYPDRLLRAASYPEACAELRAAMLLMGMGFRLRRDPANVSTRGQPRTTGPDWLAMHTHGHFGVEVKCPHESDLMMGRSAFVTHVVHAAMNLLRGQQVNLTLDPNAVAGGAIGKWANVPRAERLVLEALIEAETTGSAKTALGALAPTAPGYSSMIGPIPSDEQHEAERLRSLLEAAADQLQNWSPGIVILDSSMDPWMMRRCCRVAELMGERWASGLALVMLVADTCPGFQLTMVPGPRFDQFLSARIRGPRGCSKGHLHVDTFGKPERSCSLDDTFQNYPALCVPGVGHQYLDDS
jgi:hypothetical protein